MHFIFIILFILIFPITTVAQDLYPTDVLPTEILENRKFLENPEYKLELKSVESENTTPTAAAETLSSSQRRLFNAQGYIVTPYFYFKDRGKNHETYAGGLTLTLTNSHVSFDQLLPNTEQKKEIKMNINAEGKYGYQLIAAQLSPFKSRSQKSIGPAVSPKLAQKWESKNMFGWGYTLLGKNIPADFRNGSYYRAFETGKSSSLLNIDQSEGLDTTTIRFKINPSSQISEGNYSTTISFVLIPKL